MPAARLHTRAPEQGIYGRTALEYDVEYAAHHAGPALARAAAISCRYPVDFDYHENERWPAFMLDLLPNGYGRDQWLEKLGLKNDVQADWPLLLNGAGFPPGNLRVAEAFAARRPDTLVPTAAGELVSMNQHPGFERDVMLERGEHFVEYAFQHGIYAAGPTDVQGAAPKLLLAEAMDGRWHAEGAIPDSKVRQCWLAKRPRGRKEADRKVLRNEAAYMTVAREMGLHVNALLTWENDTLLIPRFDRIATPDGLIRLGMESLCALANVTEFGATIEHEKLCKALLTYSSDPAADLLEYIKRDVLNVVMGNKDNHARNTAVLKWENGGVRLAPVFDFAPMYLDPEGIARVSRWTGEREVAGTPDWQSVYSLYAKHLSGGAAALRAFGQRLDALPDIARAAGVDDDVIEHLAPGMATHARALMAIQEL